MIGGLPPPRPDQMYRPPGSVGPVGPAAGVLAKLRVANSIINGNGMFFYSGFPASGNLAASLGVAAAGTDINGNAYLPGNTSYALIGGVYFASNLNGGVLSFLHAAAAAGPWTNDAEFSLLLPGGLTLDTLLTLNAGLDSLGDVSISALGNGIRIAAGANGRLVKATLAGGTVTVANTSVTANTQIFVNHISIGANAGVLGYTLNPGVGFTINSTNAADANSVSCLLVERL